MRRNPPEKVPHQASTRRRRGTGKGAPSADVGKFFSGMGQRIASEWEKANHNENAFVLVAGSAIREFCPWNVSPEGLVRWALTTKGLPPQHDVHAGFGNPPLTVFSANGFQIQAIFWTQGATAIHNHGFVGAFTVLSGESLALHYGFNVQDRISSRLAVGEVTMRDAQRVVAGDVLDIGYDLSQSVYHISRPTVSLVVRTLGEPLGGPRHDLVWPYLAFDPFRVDAAWVRATQLLRTWRELGHSLWPHLRDFLDSHDLPAGVYVIVRLAASPGLHPIVLQACSHVAARHGEAGELIGASLIEYARVAYLHGRASSFSDEERRRLAAVPVLSHGVESARRLSALLWPHRSYPDCVRDVFATLLPGVPTTRFEHMMSEDVRQLAPGDAGDEIVRSAVAPLIMPAERRAKALQGLVKSIPPFNSDR